MLNDDYTPKRQQLAPGLSVEGPIFEVEFPGAGELLYFDHMPTIEEVAARLQTSVPTTLAYVAWARVGWRCRARGPDGSRCIAPCPYIGAPPTVQDFEPGHHDRCAEHRPAREAGS